MRAPHRRIAVHHRQQRVGILGDVAQREVLADEAPGQDGEGDGQQPAGRLDLMQPQVNRPLETSIHLVATFGRSYCISKGKVSRPTVTFL